ncbi:IS66 family insertion sequence element accessory protein TnpA [Mariniblastus fucicola]|uniref:Transposase n=1 Tax=Mariniblastus fucicola TaxID=980251 RepID=A0A5B9PEV5_9BACT|nr:hypothetical protein [Mariniblastus fucicola]QEG24069.1 hypothetical protein MFFC18_39850 [Mariniblastus fucicola]
MSTRYTRADWQVWLEEYRQSGLSVKQFCELIEVSVATFYNWQRKVHRGSLWVARFSRRIRAFADSSLGLLFPGEIEAS